MISKKIFLVYLKLKGKRLNKPVIISPTLEDAKNYCRAMNKSARDYEIVPTPMIIGIHRKPCTKTDPANHIPLDLNKTAYPIKCDICESTAVYFCNYHSSVYCMEHVTQHDGGSAEFSSKTNFLVP